MMKALSATLIFVCVVLLGGCSTDENASPEKEDIKVIGAKSIYKKNPTLQARVKKIISVDGFQFKDLNGNNLLDPYEDWRLPTEERISDLLSKMTLEEKAGMLMIDTLNADWEGAVPANAGDYINTQKMTRFIFRNTVDGNPVKQARSGFGGQPITPGQAARYTNSIQELGETTRLGIPIVFKSNARNHYERSARAGINSAAGAFSEWPKEAGLAATRDMKLIEEFAGVMAAEWKAIGLRGMYGYMADLATEPRWFRVHETFSENADLVAEITSILVKTLQGGPVNPDTGVALTVKHFPGGGPQEYGLDAHYTFGKNEVFPAGDFERHLKPFTAAIDAGVSSIMPYYALPVDLTYNGVKYEQIGMAFSKEIVTDLLRDRLGFRGYVNSDTGIITDRAWGLEALSIPERIATAVNAGIDVLSGFHDNQMILGLIETGAISKNRIDEAVTRLLREQFQLGLFENPYVDEEKAGAIVGSDPFREKGLAAQRKSIVLLKNEAHILPLPTPTGDHPIKIYSMGLNASIIAGDEYGGYTVINGDYDGEKGEVRPEIPPDIDYAVIRIEVNNPRRKTSLYKSMDPSTGGLINPHTGVPWGAADTTVQRNVMGEMGGLDDGLIFGGPAPYEADMISFSAMESATTWQVTPSLKDIQAVMDAVGSKRTVLSIYFRQPYALDEESGLGDAGAILATFGVSDSALMDVLSGRFSPRGKLPFALPKSLAAIVTQYSDAAGYNVDDTLFPFGYGLDYKN